MRFISVAFAVPALFLAFASTVFADSPVPVCICEKSSNPIQSPTSTCECPFQKGSEITNEDCCDPLSGTPFGFIVRIFLAFLSSILGIGSEPIRLRSLEEVEEQLGTYQVRPAFEPQFEGAITLDDEIGIWKLPDFLNEEEVQAMKQAAKAADGHSYDCKVHFCLRRVYLDQCQDDPSYQSRIQPAGKNCLMLTDNVVELFSEDDQSTVSALKSKSKSVWPNYTSTNPLVYQKTLSDTDSFNYHIDGQDLYQERNIIAPVTTIIYLSDGGSQIVFPRANNGEGLRITPKAGMAITFFNIDDKEVPNMKAVHGVERTSADADPRMMIQDKFVYAPEMHASWGYKAEELKLRMEL